MEVTKKLITKVIDNSFDFTGGISISAMREELDRLEALGANSIDIEAYEEYGSICVSCKATMTRWETDEELKARNADAIAWAKKAALMHRNELAKIEAHLAQLGEDLG